MIKAGISPAPLETPAHSCLLSHTAPSFGELEQGLLRHVSNPKRVILMGPTRQVFYLTELVYHRPKRYRCWLDTVSRIFVGDVPDVGDRVSCVSRTDSHFDQELAKFVAFIVWHKSPTLFSEDSFGHDLPAHPSIA